MKRSFVIFICTFDLFGEGAKRPVDIFTLDDVTPEMKKLLDFIDGKEPEDEFTRELNEAVQSVRKNEKWRLDTVKESRGQPINSVL